MFKRPIYWLCVFLQKCEYKRREPEMDLLHQVLSEHLETFLDQGSENGYSLPRYVVTELREYLKCGILAYGFVRIRCNDCGKSVNDRCGTSSSRGRQSAKDFK